MTNSRERRNAGLGIHATVYASVNSMLLLMWLSGPKRIFWPMYPILGWGSGLVAHVLSTRKQSGGSR